MDPPTMISEGTSYNFLETWQFPGNGGGGIGDSGGGLGMRSFVQFVCGMSPNNQESCDDPTSLSNTRGHGGGGGRKRPYAEDEMNKGVSTSTGIDMNGCAGKKLKKSGRRGDDDAKAEVEPSSTKPSEGTAQVHEPSKQDCIHVRARRGQATDSHSLAERARREKISERMRILQDLVPGCNKIIGKALVLDEIINYVQSLQRQVEFLSMKLETVNSQMNSGIEAFPQPDFNHQTFDSVGMGFGSQASREYERASSPQWLHMQIGGGFERTA